MKSFLRGILTNFFSLFLVAKLLACLDFSENIIVLLLASLYLSVFNLVVKPVLNLLLMPINLLTLGASRWIINVVVLFLVTLFVHNFRIVAFTFPGLNISSLSLPAVHFSFFWALIIVSFILELLTSVINWVLK